MNNQSVEQQNSNDQSLSVNNKYSGWAIGGFIVGLFSIPILSPVAITGVVPTLAIILSWIGFNQIKKEGLKGKQFAITGMVFGIIGLLYTAILIAFGKSIITNF
jgi:hypothetical protein